MSSSSLAGTVRLLEHKKRRPADGRTSAIVDREALRVWAAKRLRSVGVERLRYDDRLDSVQLLKKRKAVKHD